MQGGSVTLLTRPRAQRQKSETLYERGGVSSLCGSLWASALVGPLKTGAVGDADAVDHAGANLEHELRRTLGSDALARIRPRALGDADDARIRADENNIEWHRRILHPETLLFHRIAHEQHSTHRRQRAAFHEPPRLSRISLRYLNIDDGNDGILRLKHQYRTLLSKLDLAKHGLVGAAAASCQRKYQR